MRTLARSFFRLTHAAFSPKLPTTAQALIVPVSLALPNVYPLRALTC